MATKRRLIQSLLVVMLLVSACAAPASPQKATSAANPPGAAKTPAAAAQPSVSATELPTAAAQPSESATELPPADTGVAADLARRLTGSTSVADAVAATREALALGGIATWDGQRFLAEAAAPAASGFVVPEESVTLAMEARQRPTAGRLTLAQLGDMLKDLGWPFQEGSTPGEQLRDIFRALVADGLAEPNAPLSFTPLFLREMALTQQPAIDLAQGDYDPEQLHLTLLELELFAAHFDRLGRLAAETSWNKVPGLAMPVAQAVQPCSDAKKWLESQADDTGQGALAVLRVIANDSLKQYLKQALQQAGFTEAQAGRFTKALSALSIASKLWKLVALYTQAQVVVSVEGSNPIHKPSASEGRMMDGFRARAGVSDEDWQEYQQAMVSSDVVRGLRDCFNTFGLPVLPDLGDMGKEAKDWKVEWRLTKGSPEHAFISLDANTFYLPGQLEMKLEPDGDHSASALLVVDITPEKGQTHSGPEEVDTVVASAALHTAKPPSIATWANAVKGGLGNILALSSALAELGAGWIAEMLPPKAYATLVVNYHEGGGEGWSGRITYMETKTVDETESGTDPWGVYSFTHRNAENSSQTATVDVSGGKLRASDALEEIWDLSGFATVIAEEEQLTDNSRDDDGCKGGEVATEHERSYSSMNASGNGPVTGDLILSNNGTYELNFGSLPEAPGEVETQYDYWWDNKPCVEDERHDQYTDPQSVYGHEIFVEGTVDPKNPGVLSGQYDVEEPGGYKITVVWNLRKEN